jgi:hypothetical protein
MEMSSSYAANDVRVRDRWFVAKRPCRQRGRGEDKKAVRPTYQT